METLNQRKIRFLICLLAGIFMGHCVVSGQSYGPPQSYYSSLPVGLLEGDSLNGALHDIIDRHSIISYGDLPELFEIIDRDPANASNVILLYSGYSVSGTSSSWNREHTWPRSYGADSGPAYSDAHHLFPTDVQANSDRSNYGFANLDGNGSPLTDAPQSLYNSSLRMVEPRDADKGRIARALMYMEVRYDGSDSDGDFVLSDYLSTNDQRHGKITDLLEWNRSFPPDEREKRRNHLISTGVTTRIGFRRQGNRNPFVDYPGLAELVYPEGETTVWHRWQIEQFTLSEVSDGFADELADPDSDGLSNLMEFAIQTSPSDPEIPSLFTVTASASGNYITFNRIKEPIHSHITYAVEESILPEDENSWLPIGIVPEDLLVSDLGTYEQVSLYHQPTHVEPVYYRLVIERSLPGKAPIRTTFPYDVSLYTLSVIVEDGGAVNITSAGYVEPTQVELLATPVSGYQFTGWSGALVSESNPVSLLVDGTLTVEAGFSPDLSDADGDGLSAYDELVTFGSDPLKFDTSGDGLGDGALVEAGYDPTVSYAGLKAVVEASMEFLRPGVLKIDRNSDGSLTLKFDIERSSDMETWSVDPVDRVEKVLEADPAVEFFRYVEPD